MIADNVVNIALQNLEKSTGITGIMLAGCTSGMRQLELTGNGCHYIFNTTVINEVRNAHLPGLITKAATDTTLLVIANKIFPNIKHEFRIRDIAYLETCGNIYFHRKEMTMWIETSNALPLAKEAVNRAFTKTGLKVIFHFLLDEDLINQPYRAIAERTGVSLGNITNVMDGLKKLHYLLRLNGTKYKMHNKKELCGKWIGEYAEKLKPSLLIGRFRFLNDGSLSDWKELPLAEGKSYWGGEPAADLLNRYLKPGQLTLYTAETREEIIRNYRLIPDNEHGNVAVYQKFWPQNESGNIAPHWLVYTDLLNTGDRRCMETAKKIYDEYLQDKF